MNAGIPSSLSDETLTGRTASIGDNSRHATIDIEIRLFNRIHRLFGDGQVHHRLSVEAGTTVGDVLERMQIPESEVFLAFVNGRDISRAPGSVRLQHELEEDDVLALSGAVPYSWGYGAPVV